MIQLPLEALGAAIGVLAAIAGVVLAVWIVFRILGALFVGIGALFSGLGRLVAHVFTCLKGIVVSALRYVGSLLTAVVFLPMVLFSIVLGRWSAATHYGRAAGEELRDAALSLYRCGVGYPLRLVGLSGLVAGFERRIPEVIARAPGADRPTGGTQSFEGYEVIGSLPPGGSGAKLYLATASDQKAAQLAQAGVRCPDKVVIKAFSIESGSTVPQMMREGRALEAARDLGLVIEHQTDDAGRFHYVMPFVPGEDLGQVTRGLHAASGTDGLNDTALRACLGYGSGLLAILSRFHRAGLWHKDIKPNNIIVSGERVELVDLGLVTPLASAMTLTTHGTEYYRDPELVRLAMQGVKVQDVDGVKFDLYSSGAVLYNLVENEFPAHGSLSKITRRCPDALRWIIRRSMADLKSRYASAEEMHGDLRALLAASDPFAVKPAQLPSMGGAPAPPAGDFDLAGGLNPVEPTAGGPVPPNGPMAAAGAAMDEAMDEAIAAANFAADTPQRKRQAKRKSKKVRAPMGALAFVGMTLAVLSIPFLLGLAMFGVRSVEYRHDASSYAPPPMPAAFAQSSPSKGSPYFARGFPGAFPRPPYAPVAADPQLPDLPDAPPMPSSVQEAMLGARLDGVVDPTDWADAAEELADVVEDWVERVDDDVLSERLLHELEEWTSELEDWADQVDDWVDDLERVDQRDGGRLVDYLTVHHSKDAAWEAHLADLFEAGFRYEGEPSLAIYPADPCAAEPAAIEPVDDRPTPRVLVIAQRRHQIPLDVSTVQNRVLTEHLGWTIVSEDVGSDDPADDAFVARARSQANFSEIDDPEVNYRLGRQLLDGSSFDAILRWTYEGAEAGVRSHLILADDSWTWMSVALEEAQDEHLARR